MSGWWRRRSLKFRLTLWYATVSSLILLGLAPVGYALIERRLHAEFDRQLRVELGFVASHLEWDRPGHLIWRPRRGISGDGLGGAHAWFDAWTPQGHCLLRHWPRGEDEGGPAPPPAAPGAGEAETFGTLDLGGGVELRVAQRRIRVGGQEVDLRVLRDEAALHGTLREILLGFLLGVPPVALLSALAGYLMAARSLAAVGAMAERARQITMESLDRRLPNPNPHDELGQLATVFNETLQRLQDSFLSLRRFTADASHELRTPLTALRAVGEVALRGGGDARSMRETVASMLEEAQRLNDIIDSLLFLARMESGLVSPRREPFSVGELLGEIRESLGVLAAERGQRVVLAIDRDCLLDADRALLRQAVMNILHNAIRYGPEGEEISLRCAVTDSATVIDVADRGPGIAREHQSKVFERFYRIDGARSRVDGGTGLGLAIARSCVEQQGGRIEVSSAPGKGSTFRIIFDRSHS